MNGIDAQKHVCQVEVEHPTHFVASIDIAHKHLECVSDKPVYQSENG